MSTLLPVDVQVGKCYNRCFSLTEKWEWKEVDCKKKELKSVLSKKEQTQLMIKRNRELRTYQEKLKNLGYKIKVTGKYDKATYYAHHKYLRKKAKYERKREKRAKKNCKKKQKQ